MYLARHCIPVAQILSGAYDRSQLALRDHDRPRRWSGPWLTPEAPLRLRRDRHDDGPRPRPILPPRATDPSDAVVIDINTELAQR